MIQWTEKTVRVSVLKPYERNPRRISKEAYERLKASIQESGYHQRIIATKELRVIGGHQRIAVLNELGVKQIAVLVPDRELTAEEFRKLLIQDNLLFGEWDFELLSADFSIDELTSFGMPESWLTGQDETEPEANEGSGDGSAETGEILTCPKCKHEFSVVEKKKSRK